MTRRTGAFLKTSMLQDVEAGKPLDSSDGAHADRGFGKLHSLWASRFRSTDALLGLSRLNARVRGLYPGSAT